MMTHSDQIGEIAGALAKAQSEMGGAIKDASNPFFKSKYADLASVMEACRGPLTKHGIAVLQSPSAEGAVVSIETTLMHASGQWIRGVASATAKDDSPQSIGSAITYLRRYALQSFAGVAPEDDDGEAAQGRKSGQAAKPVAVSSAPKGFEEWLTDIGSVADEGTEALQRAWKASKVEYRTYLTATYPKTWDSLKAKAEKVAVSA
jgi:hypothetical protein